MHLIKQQAVKNHDYLYSVVLLVFYIFKCNVS